MFEIDKKEFGSFLAGLRKEKGMTQKELAEKLGVNPSTVSKYMRLDKYPSLDTFANICEILDISADDILGLK